MKNLTFDNTGNSLFSIIVVSYNNLEFLFNCLDSIFIQDYSSFELIVSDDSSADFDEESVFKYIVQNKKSNLSKLILYSNEINLGTVRNINKALKMCSGDYVKILACDDALFDKNVLSNAAAHLDVSRFGIISSNVYKCNPIGFEIIGKYDNSFIEKYNGKDSFFLFKANCKHNRIIAPSIFFARSFFKKYGLFDEECVLIEDWSKWLQIFNEGATIEYCDFYSVKYRFDSGVGRSTNKLLLNDKKIIFNKYIRANKKTIGFWCYFLSTIEYCFRTSLIIRRIYSFFKR